MLAYSYDPISGEYKGEVEAGLDPLETKLKGENVYALPAHSLLVLSLSPKEGYAICYSESVNDWIYVEDHRGKTIYSKIDLSERKVAELGAIPEGYTLLIPADNQEWDDENQEWKDIVIPYETKKTLKHREIDALKKAKELAGVPYIFPGGISGIIQTRDVDDFRNINATATNGLIKKGTTAKLPFRDQENRNYELTPEEGIALGEAVAAYIGAIAVVSWAHKDALTKENIDNYDISIGWPG